MPEPADPETATDIDASDSVASAPTVAASPGAVEAARRLAERVDRYVLLEPLGEGGMGVVYAAYDPDLDRKIALKFLHGETLPASGQARLLREAQAMAKLSHPNVATVFDVGTHEGRVFIAMELVRGPTLKGWLRTRRSWRELWPVFRQAAAGLGAAHEAGIVHRDFKPANVLLDANGRAHVTDFGIARGLRDDETEPARGPAKAMSVELTETGALIGTPGYMAPEQYTGGAVDARTDQFAFAIALYEAIYGERPFAGKTVVELAEATSSGAVRDGPAGTDVPAWRRKILVRALSPDPADRYESMADLVAALDFDPAARTRRLLGGGATIAVFAGLVVFSATRLGGESPACDVDPSLLGDAWSESRKAAVERAVLATDLPYAGEVWTRVESGLDDYEAAWLAEYGDACEATHERREQSDAVLDLRMRCLRERRRVLAATTELMTSQLAPKEVLGLVDLVSGLPLVSSCRDIENLQAVAPLPDDVDARRRIDEVTGDLERAAAEVSAGRYQAAVARLDGLASAVAETGYAPLAARSAALRAMVHRSSTEFPAAEKILKEAILAASDAGNRVLEAQMWIELILVLGDENRAAEAIVAELAAKAALARAGSPPGLEAKLYDAVGLRTVRAGDLKTGLELWTKAASMHREVRGADSLAYGRALTRLGTVQSWTQKPEEGLASTKKGLVILERELGTSHPDVMKAYRAVGEAELYSSNYEAAREALLRAVASAEQLFGADHPQVAITLERLGVVYLDLGAYEDAVAAFERAIAITAAKLGPEDGNLGGAYTNLGITLRTMERFAESEEALRRALAIANKALEDPNHRQIAEIRASLGRTLLERGEHDEAHELCSAAQEIVADDVEENARALICIGRATLGLGDTARAITELERAVATAAADDAFWHTRSRAAFWLARALEKAGRDDARAAELVAAAHAAYDEHGYTHDLTYRRMTAWLAEHR